MKQVVPDFFIIGAIKSGTTTLANYLIQHPEVYMPGTWEFNYLADDLNWTSPPVVKNDLEYFAHFKKGEGKRRIGEKSVYYLYSRRAARRIHEINPKAKLICVLRNPVELLWSLFKYNVANFEEDIYDFQKALAAEEVRKAGREIPKTGTIAQNLFYRDIIQFDVQIQNYLDLFQEDQIKICLFDELKTNPEKLYREILDFLELSDHPLSTKEKFNQGNKIELQQARLYLHRHQKIKLIWNRIPSPFRKALKKLMVRLRGNEPEIFKQIPLELEQELYREFSPMIQRLSTIIDRDLTIWHLNSVP